MKKIFFLILSFCLTLSGLAQQNGNEELKKNNPFIRIEPKEVNLGSIPVDKVTDELGNVEITVHNDGSKPLILNQVTACCGTRVNEWPNQPIVPGGKGTIKVYFRVGTHAHRISRTVTINSNAANGNTVKVPILGEVVLPPDPKEIKLIDSK
jgi:hypothetical protein